LSPRGQCSQIEIPNSPVLMPKVENKPASEESAPHRTRKHGTPDFGELLTETLQVRSVAINGLFVLAIFYTLYLGRTFFLPITLAFLLSFLFSPLVRILARLRIPEAVGAGLVLVVVVGAVVVAVATISQPAAQWIQQAPKYWKQVQQKADGLIRPATQLNETAQKVEAMADGTDGNKTPKVEVKPSTNLVANALTWTKDLVTQAVVLVILLYFLLASGDMFTLKLAKVLPRVRDKKQVIAIIHETEQTISTYLFTVAVINCCLGTCVGLIMFFLGMPNPLMWGVMAALFNFIPYFGPLVGVGVLALAGVVQFDSVAQGILPAACYLCLHGIEANFVTPTVLGHRLALNPIVVFISLMFWSLLWGVIGAFLAVPILMACKIVCDHVEVLSPISELLGP